MGSILSRTFKIKEPCQIQLIDLNWCEQDFQDFDWPDHHFIRTLLVNITFLMSLEKVAPSDKFKDWNLLNYYYIYIFTKCPIKPPVVGWLSSKVVDCFLQYAQLNPVKGRRHGTTIGGGGRGLFEVDSFHATPIGIMLNTEKFAGDRSPPVPPPMPVAWKESTSNVPRPPQPLRRGTALEDPSPPGAAAHG